MPLKKMLDKLNGLSEITIPLRIELERMMTPVTLEKGARWLDFGAPVDSAWYIETGDIEGLRIVEGLEKVRRLYGSNAIFTDMDAFFKKGLATMRFNVLNPCKLWVLQRSDYFKLEQMFAETQHLKTGMLLLETALSNDHGDMLVMQEKPRVWHFCQHYPFQNLPNKTCASFLDMYDSDYCSYKNEYLRQKR